MRAAVLQVAGGNVRRAVLGLVIYGLCIFLHFFETQMIHRGIYWNAIGIVVYAYPIVYAARLLRIISSKDKNSQNRGRGK